MPRGIYDGPDEVVFVFTLCCFVMFFNGDLYLTSPKEYEVDS